MNAIYFDNAATTPLLKEVADYTTFLQNDIFGNPSSLHVYGRKAKVLLETSRKTIAKILQIAPSQIVFTSNASEANNLLIYSLIINKKIQTVISSEMEHPSVLNALRFFDNYGHIKLLFVNHLNNGTVNLEHLETLLQKNANTLVALMHANNETGCLLPMRKVAHLCKTYQAFFHTDMVQSIAHFENNLSILDIDSASVSAHKFYGPKGVGFLYCKNTNFLQSAIHGGNQEFGLRAGTENIIGIAGMAKALEWCYNNCNDNIKKYLAIKNYFVQQIKNNFKDVIFAANSDKSGLNHIVNIGFKSQKKLQEILMLLDISGVCVSGGSACHSQSTVHSRVIEKLNMPQTHVFLRFSFNLFNTTTEVDYCIKQLQKNI